MSISDNPQNNQQEHTGAVIQDGRTPFVMVDVPLLAYLADPKNGFKPSALAVYCALLRRADRDHKCFPVINTIAIDSGTSPATVKRTLQQFVQHAILHVGKIESRVGYDRNIYTILPFRPQLKMSPAQLKMSHKLDTTNKNQLEGGISPAPRGRKADAKSTSPASPPVNYGLREDADGEYDALTPYGDAQEGE